MVGDFWKYIPPLESPGVDFRVVDNAISHPDVVIEICEDLSALSSLDPDGQPRDLDGFFVQVDSVDVVLEDRSIRIEERSGEFAQS